MPRSLSERIGALEQRRPPAKGGVVRVQQQESIEEALAHAGHGQYLVLPEPCATTEEWEESVREEEQVRPSCWATKLQAYERFMGEGAAERARFLSVHKDAPVP